MAKRVNKKPVERNTGEKNVVKKNGAQTGKVGKGKPPVEHQFSSTNQPAKNGRPKKIYTILKESGFSADDIRTAFGEVAWYNIKDLKALFEKDDTPVILKVIANAYRNAAKGGKYSYIKEILEQHMGKAMQKSDITSGGEKIGLPDTSNLTDKELIDYNKLLVKMKKRDA